MTITPTGWATLITVVLGVIVMAGMDDSRWYRFFRRKHSRRKNELPAPQYDGRSWHRIAQDQWKRGFR